MSKVQLQIRTLENHIRALDKLIKAGRTDKLNLYENKLQELERLKEIQEASSQVPSTPPIKRPRAGAEGILTVKKNKVRRLELTLSEKVLCVKNHVSALQKLVAKSPTNKLCSLLAEKEAELERLTFSIESSSKRTLRQENLKKGTLDSIIQSESKTLKKSYSVNESSSDWQTPENDQPSQLESQKSTSSSSISQESLYLG